MDMLTGKLVEAISNALKGANVKVVKGRLNKSDELIFMTSFNALAPILCPNMKLDISNIRTLSIAHYEKSTKEVNQVGYANDPELFDYLKSTFFVYDCAGDYEVYERLHDKKGFTVREVGLWSDNGRLIRYLVIRLGDKLDNLKEAIAESIEEGGDKSQSVSSWLVKSLELIFQGGDNNLDQRPSGFTGEVLEPSKFFIDTSFISKGQHPAFDEFTDKLECVPGVDAAKYFRAYIWSLFETNDRNRVFLYLYGEGQDGKSAVINTVLSPIEALKKTVDFSQSDSHSSETFYDKRVLLNNENKKMKLAEMGLIKIITGGDSILVNPKGRKGFDAKMNAKIIVISNEKPVVSPREAEMSRLLPMQVLKKQVTLSDSYIVRLENELPHFLYTCREDYLALKNAAKGGYFMSIEEHLRKSGKYKDYNGLFVEDVVGEEYGFEFEGDPTKVTTKIDVLNTFSNMLKNPRYEYYKDKVDVSSDMLWHAFVKFAKSKGVEVDGHGDPRRIRLMFSRFVKVEKSTDTNNKPAPTVDFL